MIQTRTRISVCGQPAHLISRCPQAAKKQGNMAGTAQPGLHSPQRHVPDASKYFRCVAGASGDTWSNRGWYIPVSVEKTDCFALVDTGSSATLVRPEVLDV